MIDEQHEFRESSNLHWGRYANGALFVDFKNARGVKVSTYRYDGTLIKGGTNPTGCFPLDVWEALKRAPRPGVFFAERIRNVYKGVKQ